MRLSIFISGIMGLGAAACGGNGTSTADASGDVPVLADAEELGDVTSTDAAFSDLAADVAGLEDLPQDVAAPGDDAISADGLEPDAVEPLGPIVAVAGARCAETARIGVIEVERQDFPEVHFSLGASITAAAHPGATAPAIERGTCAHFVQPDGCSEGCAWTEACTSAGACATMPGPYGAFVLTAEAGSAREAFEATGETGAIQGDLTLDGEAFGFRLVFGDVVVVLPAMAVPGALRDVQGTLAGDYDRPEGVDVTWSGGEVGAFVTTTVPINHHVGGNTFTRCDVSSESGSMAIPGDMLKPLAVVTGLEFQGIEHIRFAAATTDMGCVEFRFLSRAYVSLF